MCAIMITKKEYKEIRVKLLKKDVSLAQIARKFHVPLKTVQLTVRGQRDSDLARKIRSHVDKLLAEEEAVI